MSIAIETNGKVDLAAECEKWEKQCAALIEEQERLRAELAKTQSERDAYLKTVYSYLRNESSGPTFTREEVFAAVENEPSFGDMVADLKKQYAQEK